MSRLFSPRLMSLAVAASGGLACTVAAAPECPDVPTASAPFIEARQTQSPEEICRRLASLADDPNVTAKILAECPTFLHEEQVRYEQLSACLGSAATIEAASACPSAKAWAVADVRDVCGHLVDVMGTQRRGDGDELTGEDRAKALDHCIDGAEQERERIGDVRFNEQARCMMRASSMDAVMECDDDDSRHDVPERKAEKKADKKADGP